MSVYDPALKRKRWIGTFETLREAREAERGAGRRRGSAARLTCGEFVRLWQENYARPAPATQRTYRYALRQFEADFGHLRLTDLDRLVARPWALTQPQSNVRAVRAMLNDAINDGLHPGPNPFANLRLEQPRGRKDLDALSEEELQTLAGCARTVHEDYGPTFQAMVIFAAYVGLRPGELFALHRGDVDQDEVVIRRNLDATGQLKLPKNGKERIVILPPPARDALLDVVPRVDVPWLFVTRSGRQFGRAAFSTTGTPSGPRSVVRGWTSTSFGTSARRTCSNLVCRMQMWRCSSDTLTVVRSLCPPTAIPLRIWPVSDSSELTPRP